MKNIRVVKIGGKWEEACPDCDAVIAGWTMCPVCNPDDAEYDPQPDPRT
jgi:hypothetical protein